MQASGGRGKLHRLTQTVRQKARGYRGFNFFDPQDEQLFEVIARGEFPLSGFHNKALRAHLPGFSSGPVSRLLQRLRTHGIIKKTSRGYKYYLSAVGRPVVALGLRLKHLVIVPQLAIAQAP